nr:phage head closure protein [uncultured Acetatifactor sp.]
MRDEMIYFADMVPDTSGGRDPYGDPAMELKLSDAVFAELKSIGQSEFYQAQTAGKKPEIKFKVTDYLDYQGQKYLIHEGVRYTVLRTYRTASNELEITCYGGVRDAAAAVSDKGD